MIIDVVPCYAYIHARIKRIPNNHCFSTHSCSDQKCVAKCSLLMHIDVKWNVDLSYISKVSGLVLTTEDNSTNYVVI